MARELPRIPDTGSRRVPPRGSGILRLGTSVALVAFLGWGLFDAATWPRREPRRCVATTVTDGDTLKVDCRLPLTLPFAIRLADIDAPEAAECPAQAKAATARLAALVQGQPLRVTPRTRDRWGRVVATVETPAGDVGTALLSTGHARPWPHDATGRPLAQKLEGCE